MKYHILLSFSVLLLCTMAFSADEVDVIDIEPVWAGHSVGFCLLTQPPYQFAAYYDADRQMTVAARRLDEKAWTFKKLPSRIGWDSHNYITMTLDDEGHLHVAGNMHGVPLIYFRTSTPYDISTLEQITSMVGKEEQRVTYPRFFRGPENQFVFTYRDGGSGRGNQIYNVYDLKEQTWSRLLDTPLIDGEGKRNAYISGPSKGPDGYWHMVWIWRDTPDCATNHDPAYARSKDLVHWENSRGEALKLPITFDTCDIVDPVPPGGGAINGNVRLGFDADHRPIVTYHKFDNAGKTQVYNARSENGNWKVYQLTDWDFRWEFGGNGTIGGFHVSVRPVTVEGDMLTQTAGCNAHGTQKWQLDPETLKPVKALQLSAKPNSVPREVSKLRGSFSGLHVKRTYDKGIAEEAGVRYLMRWETLGANRDRPREKPWPEPSLLQVYRYTIESP